MTEDPGFDSKREDHKEDPLEQLLDESSDDEFGIPEFRNHFSPDNTPVVLRDWTAQEFSSIYLRFKPHLERHAKRYLNNQTQVEETVQDAFLYLMTSLPELDSELGVLRFLKWKTRLLALDVIRSNSRVAIRPIEDDEFHSEDPELTQSLERADDAAVVTMALAQLTPRHREVLIASLYQEKSTEAISSDLGLSENATRQLVFRARAAFKKALVGEAETAGLRISEILSIAARKAKSDSVKIVSSTGVLALIIAGFFAFNGSQAPSSLEAEQVVTPPSGSVLDDGTEAGVTPVEPTPDEATDDPVPTNSDLEIDQGDLSGVEAADDAQDGPAGESGSSLATEAPSQQDSSNSPVEVPETYDETFLGGDLLAPVEAANPIQLGRASLASIQLMPTPNAKSDSAIEPVTINMEDDQGRRVSFDFDLGTAQVFDNVSISIVYDGVVFKSLSLHGAAVQADYENGVFVFESKIGYLVEKDRNLLELDAINNAIFRIQLETDEDLTAIKMYQVSYHAGSFDSQKL